MSKKRYIKPNNTEEVEKEYKDMDLVNSTEEETVENDNKEAFLKDVEKASTNTSNKQIDVELTVDAFIRKEPDNKSKILLVNKLCKEDKKYISEKLADYAMACIKKGTVIHCYDMGNGWYRLPSGYVYNSEVKRNSDMNRVLTTRGTKGLSRIDVIEKYF